MNWQVWIVPLIAIVVAVLASVLRGAEEAKRRANQREKGAGEPRRERPRSEGSGIDQFLEEIRRRQAARQDSAPEAQREMRKPREPRPSPPVRAEPPPRRREPQVVTIAIEAPEVPVALVAEAPAAPLPAPPPPPPAATGVTQRREAATTTAVRAQLAALLGSKRGLQTALIIREIFEKPLCRRK